MATGSDPRGEVIVGGAPDPSALAAQVAVAFAAEPDPLDSTRRLLELTVTAFADWGTVHLLQGDGTLERVAVHHRDPALGPLAAELAASPSVDPARAPQMHSVLRERRAQVHRRSPEELALLAPTPGVHDVWMRLGLASAVTVPLISEDRAVGVLALMSAQRDHFSPPEVAALERLLAGSALLAETARMARRAEAEQGERVRVRAVLDSLLAHAPVATVVVDDRGRVLHGNRALDALTAPDVLGPPGGPPPDASMVPLGRLLPVVASEIEALVGRALAGGQAVPPVEVRRGDLGERRYWQVSAFPIRRTDGDLFGAGLIFVEVTEERRASQRQQESLARLDLSLAAGGMGTWDWDLHSGRVEWSTGMATLMGVGPDDFAGTAQAVLDLVAEVDRDRVRDALVEAAEAGSDYRDEFRVVGGAGAERWVECWGRVLTSRSGVPLRMIGIATDVTERLAMEDVRLGLLAREHEVRLAAEASRERLALLAEVSAVLTATLDIRTVYENLAEVLVPRLGDWCVLDSLDDEGELHEMALVHIDPRRAPLVRELRERRRHTGGDGLFSVRRTMRTGKSERVDDITDADLEEATTDPEHLELLRALTPRSALVAPLVARGRVLGGITVVSTGSRSYDDEDRNLLENIAGRAATAVDTAMLFDSRTEVARALQQTLLPPALPEIPGIDLWADYRVAEAGIEIGGDFYDVFETETGWNVVLGDVCGKGPVAAGVTGLFRHTLRAVSQGLDVGEGPASVLRATNDTILDQLDDTRFATAVLVSLRPGRGRARASVACGGHPRPVLVRADGSVDRVEVTGTLLGVLPDPPLQEVELDLGPGDALVLYTDGVTEARDGPDQFGEAGLMEALAGAACLTSAEAISAHLVSAVDRFRDPESSADDIAVVTIRVPSIHDA